MAVDTVPDGSPAIPILATMDGEALYGFLGNTFDARLLDRHDAPGGAPAYMTIHVGVQRRFHSEDWSVSPPRIVVLDGTDIGTVSFVRREAEYHIGELYLLPEYQRRGIGAEILRRLLAVADADGAPVRLDVIKINPARSLYERHGFVICGETETHFHMIRPTIRQIHP